MSTNILDMPRPRKVITEKLIVKSWIKGDTFLMQKEAREIKFIDASVRKENEK